MGAGDDGVGVEGLRLGGWEVQPGPPDEHADAHEFTFTTRFQAEPAGPGEQVVLRFGGLATVAVVELNGEQILQSESMWLEHEVDVGPLLCGDNELVIRVLPLAPLLAERRKPRARWRTRLVEEGNLRWFRTTLLGRMPGIAPGVPPVGPWRPVVLERRGPGPWLRSLRLDGRRVHVDVVGGDRVEIELGGRKVPVEGGAAELDVSELEPWFPHTHGRPALHELRLLVDGEVVHSRRVGFRTLRSARDVLTDGLDLNVNGVPVFARGAVWTPVQEEQLRSTLELVRDAGMNMLRIPGIGCYESAAFWDLCDELGILVWQDFMFANMDYPIGDAEFRVLVEVEARQLLAGIAGRPSLAVLCGNSEVEQQVAMVGLDPELGRGELFGELLPRLVEESGSEAIYVRSSPTGGERPFRPDRGIAHWFGVGGYQRPLQDTRSADVRFASECLAFANVPDDSEDRGWVQRDNGSDWDFADVREHYRALLHGAERSPALERAVTGEVMAEVFGEWRRAGSGCRGGLVLWLRDLRPGQGWGVLDYEGTPKAAYDWLVAALAPVAVWSTDEGLAGVSVHVANDTAERVVADLRVTMYRDYELQVEEAVKAVVIDAHETPTFDLEALLGHFADVSYAYRFGAPQQHAIVTSLERDGEVLSQSVRFPVGPPPPQNAGDLGLEVDDGVVRAKRLVYGARLIGAAAVGVAGARGVFVVEPGRERALPTGARGCLEAANLLGSVSI